MFKIERVFAPCERSPVAVGVSPRERPGIALAVGKGESVAELHISRRIAPAAIGIGVPKQAILAAAHHKGNRHLGIVLEKFFVAPLVVHFLRLMLPESVERLTVGTVEKRAPRISRALFKREPAGIRRPAPPYLVWRRRAIGVGQLCLRRHVAGKCLAAHGRLLQERVARGAVDKGQTTRLLVDAHGQLRREKAHPVAPLTDRELGNCPLFHHNEAAPTFGNGVARGGLYADDAVGHRAKPQHARLRGREARHSYLHSTLRVRRDLRLGRHGTEGHEQARGCDSRSHVWHCHLCFCRLE